MHALLFLFKFYCAAPSSIAATDLQILLPSAFKEFLYHFLITYV